MYTLEPVLRKAIRECGPKSPHAGNGSARRSSISSKRRSDPAVPREQALGEAELLEAFAAHRLVARVVGFVHAVERHVEPPGEDLAELGLARPGRAVEEDVHPSRTARERAPDHPLYVVAVAGHVVEVRPFELACGRRIQQ